MKLSIAVLCVLWVLCGSTAYSAVPNLINYQGRLTTAGGAPATDGIYTVRFRVYSDSTGASPLWEETQPIQVNGGLFTAVLGGTTVIPDTLFNATDRFLGIKVNLDGELSPRTRLLSVPYALETRQWTTRGTSAVRAGGVGIGTLSPARLLEVKDTALAQYTARFTSNSTAATSIEVSNTSNNSTWEFGQMGSVGGWGGAAWPKSFYLYRFGSSMPILMADSLNRLHVNAWPTVSNNYRLILGARNDATVRSGIRIDAEDYGLIALSFASFGTAIEGYTEGTDAISLRGAAWGASGVAVSGYAIHGQALRAVTVDGLAGYFGGNVQVVGTLTKSAGSFKIDHPLDPAGKCLSHSFVESPDMKNIYDGVVTLDNQGQATVTMPEWFDALNKDFRYQLTCIGAFAPIYVDEKIVDNQFKIAGGTPGMEVSWQVTGIRHDAYANAHRIPVEEEKPVIEQGHYIHPTLFGQPEEKSVEWARHPELMRQTKAEREKATLPDVH